jgi:hypothetical protein
MTARFRLKESNEYQPFADRKVFVWSGGNQALADVDREFIRAAEPSYFVFDFEEPGNKDYFWKPTIEEASKQLLREVCLYALDMRQHFFVILGDPLFLNSVMEDAEHLAMLRGKLKDLTLSAPVWDYKKFCKHIFVGCRINKDVTRRPDGTLPWLSTVSLFSRFIWVNGELDDDTELDNLKPCADEVPTAGDYNLFTGDVYWPGTYSYRDSVNAFQHSYHSLTFVIIDFSGDDPKLLRSMERVSDDCFRYDIPFGVVNVPHAGTSIFGEETLTDFTGRLTKEISRLWLERVQML